MGVPFWNRRAVTAVDGHCNVSADQGNCGRQGDQGSHLSELDLDDRLACEHLDPIVRLAGLGNPRLISPGVRPDRGTGTAVPAAPFPTSHLRVTCLRPHLASVRSKRSTSNPASCPWTPTPSPRN